MIHPSFYKSCKYLLYGGNGWIGQQVQTLLKKNDIPFIVSENRLHDLDTLTNELDTLKPTHIICTVGRTHGPGYPTIDYLEQAGKLVENIRDNLFAPVLLAKVAETKGIHVTYLGTGCIFNNDDEHPMGDPDRGFTEADAPNFTGSSYSIVKGFTDQLMLAFNNNVLNVRIRMPITAIPSSRDFITKLLSYSKICSIPNSMTVLDDLLPIMIDMSRREITGTINLVNPGLISHDEVLAMYKDIIDPEFTWQNMTYEEQTQLLHNHRSNNCLDTSYLRTLYPTVPDIHTSVKKALLARKQYIQVATSVATSVATTNDDVSV
jgi:3,5-epimerase/4-reductase